MGSRSPRARSTTSSSSGGRATRGGGFGGLIVAIATGCGAGPSAFSHATVEAFSGGGTTLVSRIAVEEAPGHPRLALLRRDGDPTGAIAIVARVSGPREALSLATLWQGRLADAGIVAKKVAFGQSFTLGVFSDHPDATLHALHDAFASAVSQAEIAKLDALLDAERIPTTSAFLSATDACEGGFALPHAWKHLGRDELETARAAAFTTHAITFGAVGTDAFAKDVTSALSASSAFPEGPAPTPAPPATTRSAHAGHLETIDDDRTDVRIAISVQDPRAAVTAARAFELRGAPELRSKLGRLAVPFFVDAVTGVARAKGGCVSVRLHSDSASRNDADAIATATGIAERDLAEAANEPANAGVAEESVLRASDAVDAAALAAWWSDATTDKGAPTVTSIAVGFAPSAPEALVSRVEQAMSSPPPVAPTDIEVRGRLEKGQGDLWVVLANPCASALEAPHGWGATASAVTARAFERSAKSDVVVEPLVSSSAMGVVAHASAAPGESGDDLARRVATSAATVLLDSAPSAEALSRSSSRARRILERDWGSNASGLDVLAMALAPDHPTEVEPFGSFSSATRVDAARGAAAWQVLVDGPLELVVLDNESPTQSDAALAVVGRWALPVSKGTHARCPERAPSEAHVAHEVLHDDDVTGGLSRTFVALPVGKGTEARSMGAVVAALFEGDTSPASAALRSIENAHATARLVGADAAVVIRIDAPDDKLSDAEKAVTDMIVKTGSDVPDDALRRAIDVALQAEERRFADPRERALALLASPTASLAPKRVDLAAFRAWARATALEAKLTTVEVRP